MEAFDTQPSTYPITWTVEDGVLTNAPPTRNLVSKQKFTNFRLQAEYKLTTKSNSGIYLRGRYEMQVLDDYGNAPEMLGHMSIYGWTPPLVNASKPVGEWQTVDIDHRRQPRHRHAQRHESARQRRNSGDYRRRPRQRRARPRDRF